MKLHLLCTSAPALTRRRHQDACGSRGLTVSLLHSSEAPAARGELAGGTGTSQLGWPRQPPALQVPDLGQSSGDPEPQARRGARHVTVSWKKNTPKCRGSARAGDRPAATDPRLLCELLTAPCPAGKRSFVKRNQKSDFFLSFSKFSHAFSLRLKEPLPALAAHPLPPASSCRFFQPRKQQSLPTPIGSAARESEEKPDFSLIPPSMNPSHLHPASRQSGSTTCRRQCRRRRLRVPPSAGRSHTAGAKLHFPCKIQHFRC